MPSDPGRSEHVVLAMSRGRNRALLEDWLSSFADYAVTTTGPGDQLPDSYDICLFDVVSFRSLRDEIERRVAAADPVYLPHVLLVSNSDTSRGPRDRLPEQGSIADALVNEVLDLPIEKAVLYRRVENLLTARRTALRLAEREEQYHQLVELTPEGIVLLDGDEVVYANSAASTLFGGHPGAELVGDSLSSYVASSSEIAFETLVERIDATAEGTPTEFVDIEFQRADGGLVAASVAGVPVNDEGKQVVQLLLRDITQERRRKEQLQLFGRAVESVSVGVVIADATQADNPIVYANEGFQRLTGYGLTEILGQNCRFLQGPKTSESTRKTVRQAIEAGEPVSVDILNYRKNDTTFWNRLDVTPVFDESGELAHFIGFQRDISEQVRRKQRLAVLNRILRHNVRNKTNVISGYAESIERGEGSPTAAAARIQDAAEELLTISEQIREFDTVIEDGAANADRLDLSAVVAEGVATVCERGAEASVDLQVDEDSDLDVSGHHTLRTAFGNLFTLLADAPSPDCVVRLVREGDEVELTVVDRSGTLTAEELSLVESGTESSLEHLQRLELWLLRWAVDQSAGRFEAETLGEYPALRIQFGAAN